MALGVGNKRSASHVEGHLAVAPGPAKKPRIEVDARVKDWATNFVWEKVPLAANPFTHISQNESMGAHSSAFQRVLPIRFSGPTPEEVANRLSCEALRLRTEGFFVEAILNLEQALKIVPNHYERLAAIGEIYLLTGEDAKARQSLEKAHRINPYYEPTLTLLGCVYFKQRYFAHANLLLTLAVDLNASHLNLSRLGWVRYVFGDKQKGKELLEKALYLNPNSPLVLCQLAWVLYQIGDIAKAREQFDWAIRHYPQCIDGIFLCAVMEFHLAHFDFDATQLLLEGLLQQVPDNYKALLLRAHVYFCLNDLPQAHHFLLQALDQWPKQCMRTLKKGHFSFDLAATLYPRFCDYVLKKFPEYEGQSVLVWKKETFSKY